MMEIEDLEPHMAEVLKLETDIANSEFYISSLAIGILEGMKAGIWSLGRPVFWNSFDKKNALSDNLLSCLKTFDEIEAIKSISNREPALKMIEELLSRLRICQKESLLNSPDLKLYSSIE